MTIARPRVGRGITIAAIAAKPVHVAYITPRHSHDDVRTVHKEAWTLQQAGYDVTLICKQAPVSRYLGMDVICADARAQGILRLFWNLPRLLRQSLSVGADVYVLVNPDTVLVALMLALSGKRIIYSTHEDFREKVKLRTLIPRCLRSIVGIAIVAAEYAITRLASATVVTQPDVRERYAPSAILVENAPLIEGPVWLKANRVCRKLPRKKYPTLIYAGSLTMNRGLMRMLDLVEALNRSRRWHLKLVGCIDSEKTLAAARRHPGWQHVEFLGQVPHAHALAHIRVSDIGLALLEDVGGFSRASITKLYEYMLLETPFVASDFRAWRDSIDDVPAGLFVNGEGPDVLADRISAIMDDRESYENMQRTGRTFIEKRFNWSLVSRPMLEAVGSIPLDARTAVH